MRDDSFHDRPTLLGSFFLTVVFDLTIAVQGGLLMACFLFVRRMSGLFQVDCVERTGTESAKKLHGMLFFAAVRRLEALLRTVQRGPVNPVVTIDALHLMALHATGLDALPQLLRTVRSRGERLRLRLRLRDLQAQPLGLLERFGLADEPDSEIVVAPAPQAAAFRPPT